MKAAVSWVLALALTVALAGCGPKDNPKTKNPLLREKRIGWDSGEPTTYEFLASGVLVAVGGDYPVEGTAAFRWESVDDNGSFKWIRDPASPQDYRIARLQAPMAKGVRFVFEEFSGGVSQGKGQQEHEVTVYEDLAQSHEKTAISVEARAELIRYKGDIYVLNLVVEDPQGVIKKVETEGDAITTQGMLTNVKRWINTPDIIVAEGAAPKLPLHTRMHIIFHDGHTEDCSFATTVIHDKSDTDYDDPWF